MALVPDAGRTAAGEPKIALHIMTNVGKAVCEAATPVPCDSGVSSLTVQGATGTGYHVQVCAVDADSSAGFSGATFGISYDGALQSGVDVFGWTLCAKAEFAGGPPGAHWPASGSGNVIVWPLTDCQRTPAPGDMDGGVCAVLGVLYVYAYGDDVLSITRREYVQTPDFLVGNCRYEESSPAWPGSAGAVGFGAGQGRDPCR